MIPGLHNFEQKPFRGNTPSKGTGSFVESCRLDAAEWANGNSGDPPPSPRRHTVTAGLIKGSEVPESFICLLTNQVMKDPVVDPCGHTFEKRAICAWYDVGHVHCPIGHERLDSSQLQPARDLGVAIKQWMKTEREAVAPFMCMDGGGSLDSVLAESLIRTGKRFASKGKLQEAIAAYEEGIPRTDKIVHYIRYAELLVEARLLFKASSAYVYLGKAHEQSEEPEKACEAYQKAVNFMPGERIFREELAQCLIRVGKSAEAALCYKQLVKLAQAKKQTSILEEYYQKLIELQPNVRAHYEEYLHFLKGKNQNEKVKELEGKIQSLLEDKMAEIQAETKKFVQIRKWVQSIDLGDADRDRTCEVLRSINAFSRLKVLNLAGCRGLTNEDLAEVLTIHTLKKVNLNGCVQVSGEMIRKLLKTNPKIEKLQLKGNGNLTPDWLRSIFLCGKNLKHVNLQGCFKLTDEDVETTAQKFILKLILPSGNKLETKAAELAPVLKNYAVGPTSENIMKLQESSIASLTALPGGHFVSGGRVVKVWDASTEVCQGSFTFAANGRNEVSICSLAPLAGNRLAVGDSGKMLTIWKLETKRCQHVFTQHKGMVTSLVAFSSNRLASGDSVGVINIWDIEKGRLLRSFSAHEKGVMSLIALPNAQVASGGLDGVIKVWNENACVRMFEECNSGKVVLASLPNGRLASASLDGLITIWAVETGSRLFTLSGHLGSVNCLTTLSDGRLASVSAGDVIRIWDVQTEKCLYVSQGKGATHLIALTDGRLALCGRDGVLCIWGFREAWKACVVSGRRAREFKK